MDLPDCYGDYGAGACDSCQYAEYCEGAADLPLLEENGHHWPYKPSLDGWYWAEDIDRSGGSRLSKLLAELLYEMDCDRADLLWEFLGTMSALSKEKPSTYRVARLRILKPEATYQELADDLKLTRQGVESHLQKVAELVPVLRASLVHPRKMLRTNKEERFALKCSGGNIRVLMDDKEILKMPMTNDNNNSAPHVVNALNNLHWRRRDALIEEIEK